MQPRLSEFRWMIDKIKLELIMRKNRMMGRHLIYLFLDYDGVINVFIDPDSPEFSEKIADPDKFEFANRACVARLERLCRTYPVRIVISSSWRYAGLDYCEEYLHDAGLSKDLALFGMTKVEVAVPREEEILEYLEEHPDFTGFLIMDDIDMKHLKKYEVLTDPLKGWDEERDAYAYKILERFK